MSALHDRVERRNLTEAEKGRGNAVKHKYKIIHHISVRII